MIETGDTMPKIPEGHRLRCTECGDPMEVREGQTVPACVGCGGTTFEPAPVDPAG